MKPTRITWLASLLLSATLLIPAVDVVAKPAQKTPHKGSNKAVKGPAKSEAKALAKMVPLPRPRPDGLGAAGKAAGRFAVSSAAPTASDTAPDSSSSAASRISSAPVAPPSPPASTLDLSTVKRALDLIRRGKADEATALKASVNDSGAEKLIEWAVLRSDSGEGKSFG